MLDFFFFSLDGNSFMVVRLLLIFGNGINFMIRFTLLAFFLSSDVTSFFVRLFLIFGNDIDFLIRFTMLDFFFFFFFFFSLDEGSIVAVWLLFAFGNESDFLIRFTILTFFLLSVIAVATSLVDWFLLIFDNGIEFWIRFIVVLGLFLPLDHIPRCSLVVATFDFFVKFHFFVRLINQRSFLVLNTFVAFLLSFFFFTRTNFFPRTNKLDFFLAISGVICVRLIEIMGFFPS
mmetsp:Transcript_27819/g.31982  ORF Transcript_27819/g.31982 Transcript_27819/m.31982 type:complete len:232 (-) Transcript_27819:646-1341(-)